MADTSLKRIKLESMDGFDYNADTMVPPTEVSMPSIATPREQTSYVPQFSSTSTLILSRIKLGSRSANSPIPHSLSTVQKPDTSGGDGTKSKPTQSMTSTLAMRMPVSSTTRHTPPATSNPSSNSWSFLDVGAKRKRDASGDKVDFTQNTIAFPWVDQNKNQSTGIQSTRIQSQPREPPSRTCSKCEAQSRAPEDTLVACSRCAKSWHQQCHSPAITSQTTRLSNFVCSACGAEQEETVRLKGKVSQQRQGEIERLRQKRLASLPQGVAPAKSGLVGFGAGQASDSSRTEYFSDMKKMDLLNILSLCDQLKPQLLTDILVSVSKRHPDLPIFNSPDWETELASAQRPVKPPSKPYERPRHGHVILNGKARLKVKATKKILKRTRVIEVVADMPGEDEDVLPPTWRKSNEGIYATLVPDTEDDSLLVDENDEESFSHFMVDGFGKQIVEAIGG